MWLQPAWAVVNWTCTGHAMMADRLYLARWCTGDEHQLSSGAVQVAAVTSNTVGAAGYLSAKH